MGLLSATTVNATLDDELLFYWNMEQTTGECIDIKSNSGNCNITIVSDQETTGIVNGKNAYEYDGTNDFLLINSTPFAGVGLEYTVSVWYFPTLLNGNRRSLFSSGVGPDFELIIQDDDDMYIGGTGVQCDSNTEPVVNQWNHILAIMNDSATDCQIYLNGEKLVTNSGTAHVMGSTHIGIGHRQVNGANKFIGFIDDVAVWNRTLTDAEIVELNNSGTQAECTGDPCSFLAPPANVPPNVEFRIFANDFFDNTNLTNFTATVSNSSVMFRNITTNGVVLISGLLNISNYDVNFSSSNSIGITDGLVSYYNFNDNTGDLHGGNGGVINGTMSCAVAGIGTGGQACDFNGQDNYINMSNGTSLDILNKITLMGWVNPNQFQPSGDRYIMTKGDDTLGIGGINYGINMGSGGFIRFLTGDDSISSIVSLATSNYTHIAISFDDTTDRILFYFNGSLVRNTTFTTDLLNESLEELTVGALVTNGVPAGFWNGTIDELKIYNRVLSTDEILSEFETTDQFFFTNQEYFNLSNQTILVNDSTQVSFVPFQSYIIFNSSQIFTGNILNGFDLSVNISSTAVNTSLGATSSTNQIIMRLKAQRYTLLAQANNHFNITSTFVTTTGLQNTTIVLSFGDAKYNFTVFDAINNLSIGSGFSLNISATNSSESFSRTTTTPDILDFILLRGNNYDFTATFTNDLFSPVTGAFIGDVVTKNLSIFALVIHTINIQFFNEETNLPLTIRANETFDIDLIGPTTLNLTTANGTIFITNLSTGDYEIRYKAPQFSKRSFFVTLPTSGSADLDLFLLNETIDTLIVLTIVDENDDPLNASIAIVQRFYTSDNQFKTIEMSKAAFNGEAPITIIKNTQEYRFLIQGVDGNIIFSSTEFKVTSDTLKIRVPFGAGIFSFVVGQTNIATSLTVAEAGNQTNFSFTFVDTKGFAVSGCLDVTQIGTFGESLICQSCATSSATTLTCSVDGTKTLIAIGSINSTDGRKTQVAILTVTKAVLDDQFGNLGVLLAFILMFSVAAVGFVDMDTALVLGVVAVGITAAMGLFVVSAGVVFALGASALVIMLLGRR